MYDMRLIRIPDFRPKIKRQPDISSGRLCRTTIDIGQKNKKG